MTKSFENEKAKRKQKPINLIVLYALFLNNKKACFRLEGFSSAILVNVIRYLVPKQKRKHSTSNFCDHDND